MRAEVAVDPQGNAVFVWERREGTAVCCLRVEARVRSANGTLGATQILSAAGQDAQEPHVAVAANGTAFAVLVGNENRPGARRGWSIGQSRCNRPIGGVRFGQAVQSPLEPMQTSHTSWRTIWPVVTGIGAEIGVVPHSAKRCGRNRRRRRAGSRGSHERHGCGAVETDPSWTAGAGGRRDHYWRSLRSG